jgi:hypothetical protein
MLLRMLLYSMTHRLHVADVQGCLLAAVDVLAAVHTLGGDEQLLVSGVPHLVAEVDLQYRNKEGSTHMRQIRCVLNQPDPVQLTAWLEQGLACSAGECCPSWPASPDVCRHERCRAGC